MRPIVCAILLSTLLWSRPANADRITIEPDDFAAGTNLTAATAGVMLWTAYITGSSGNPTGTVAMTAPDAIMKYVFAGSTEGGIALDRLSFDQVPEPSTPLLTITGLFGWGRHLRRRRRSE